ENITRYLEKGFHPLQAALHGAREIGFTVLSMSASLVAVFIPILLMGGIIGRLFREFAVTLSVAIAVSVVISLTTTPMMCARFLKSERNRKHGRLYRASEYIFDSVLRGYGASLSWVLRHQGLVLAVTLATMGLNIYLYMIVPKGFFPQQDVGRLVGNIQGAQDISFQAMREKLGQFVRIVMADPAMDTAVAFTGGGTPNTGRLFGALKPLGERKISADQVIGRLRGHLSSVPGANLFLQAVQDIRVGGRMSSAQYQFTLRSDSVKELTRWTPQMLRRLRMIPQL